MPEIAQAFSRAAARSATPAAPSSRSQPAARAAYTAGDKRHRTLASVLIGTLIVLMIVPEGFDYASLATMTAPVSGDLLSRLLWLGLLFGGLALILLRAAAARRLLASLNPFLLAFVVLALASMLWSIEPTVTVRRMVRVLTIVIDSLAFALVAWHARRFQSLLRPVITAVLVGSLAFGAIWPELAIHQDDKGVLMDAWHGLANHKNSFGDIACIGMILWFHAWLSGQARSLPALLGSGVALSCVFLSRSSTSLLASVFTLLMLLMLLRSPRALRRYMPYLVTLFSAALLFYSLALLHVVPGLDIVLSPISAITGKDTSFTGRTEIWDIVSEHIRQQPWLGSGYGAFWTGPTPGAPSYEFVARLYFYPGSAHNGYLDVLNDLGAFGLLLLLGYLAAFLKQALRLLPADRSQAALYLALLLQQAIGNLTESRWFNVLSIDFVIMTLASAALARALLERRRRGMRSPVGTHSGSRSLAVAA